MTWMDPTLLAIGLGVTFPHMGLSGGHREIQQPLNSRDCFTANEIAALVTWTLVSLGFDGRAHCSRYGGALHLQANWEVDLPTDHRFAVVAPGFHYKCRGCGQG
jgi:hypothetical protein